MTVSSLPRVTAPARRRCAGALLTAAVMCASLVGCGEEGGDTESARRRRAETPVGDTASDTSLAPATTAAPPPTNIDTTAVETTAPGVTETTAAPPTTAPDTTIGAPDDECPTGRALLEPSLPSLSNDEPNPDFTLQAGGEGVLDFGSLLPASGVLSSLATPMYAGLQVAVDEINAAGGVLGSPVTISHVDSGDIFDDRVLVGANQLLDADVDAIIGPLTTAATQEVLGPITDSGTILFGPSAAGANLAELPDSGRYFRTQAVDEFRARALAEVVLLDGHDTVAVSTLDDNLFNTAMSGWFIEEFLAGGGTVIFSHFHSDQEPVSDDFVGEVGGSEPDAIVLIGFDEVATILDGLVAVGLGPKQVATYATDAGFGSWLATTVFESWEIACMVGLVAPEAATLEFGDRLIEVNPELQDFTLAAETYDAAVAVALAAVMADTDDAVAVADHVNDVTRVGTKCFSFGECRDLIANEVDIDFDGQSGPLEFDDAGEPSVAVVGVGELDAAGQLRVPTNYVYSG